MENAENNKAKLISQPTAKPKILSGCGFSILHIPGRWPPQGTSQTPENWMRCSANDIFAGAPSTASVTISITEIPAIRRTPEKSPLLLLIQDSLSLVRSPIKLKTKDRWWLKPNNIRSWQSVSLFSNPNAARISWNPPLRFLHIVILSLYQSLFSRQLRDEAFAVRFSTFLSPACSNANRGSFFRLKEGERPPFFFTNRNLLCEKHLAVGIT